MKKIFAKCLAIAAFALITTTSFAETNGIKGSVQPISELSQPLLTANVNGLPVLDVILINWTPDEITELAPLGMRIGSMQSGRAYSENWTNNYVTVQFVIDGQVKTLTTFRRATIDVKKLSPHNYDVKATNYDK